MITLKTLPQATAQEVFDQVKTHLLAQNEKCEDAYTGDITQCKYHHADLKCAAGCLVSEGDIKPEMMSYSWEALIREKIAPREHCILITDLQAIHDHAEPVDWPKALKCLANDRGLVYE